ncbi:Transcriptional activator spt7 [Entophlyctis luteolus]|nr:Transcriptional activator spt7 [Entophlyctis luteolus]
MSDGLVTKTRLCALLPPVDGVDPDADCAAASVASDPGSLLNARLRAEVALEAFCAGRHSVHASHLRERLSPAANDGEEEIEFDDMYYTLEFDRAFIREYNPDDVPKLKRSSEDSKKLNQKTDAKSVSDPENLNYLFEVIGKNARPEKAKELKNLVHRLKRSRSKWAHDYRIGQETLYEALEKVLTDLKNYTVRTVLLGTKKYQAENLFSAKEHSEPFLQRVSKKDSTVIKNPMDLGTMTKKLQNLEYMSKDDFAADLSLIWSNCLTFNVVPESIYRKHAFSMKKRSLELLKKVPDIRIVIKPQEPESESDDGNDGDEKPELSNTRKAFSGKSARRSSTSEEPASGAPQPSSNVQTPMLIDSSAPTASLKSVPGAYANTTSIENSMVQPKNDVGQAQTTEAASNGMCDVDADEDYTAGVSAKTAAFLKTTAETRKQNFILREHSLNTPFSDRPALVSAPEKFTEFLIAFERISKRKRPSESSDTVKYDYFMPELTNFGTCLPQIPQPQFNSNLSEYPESLPDSNSSINLSIFKNTETLRKIKEIYTKIVEANDTSAFPNPIGLTPTASVKRVVPGPAGRPDFALNNNTAAAIISQCVGKLLVHAGFDGAQQSAVALLSDVAQQYLSNLGRTMLLYATKRNQKSGADRILQMALQVNGISSAGKLDLYVRNDVQRYGAKLLDVKRRLATMYKSLLESSALDPSVGDIRMSEIDPMIMSGNFLEDLGVDFLNLRDLGIDITAIPVELWNRKAEGSLKIKRKIAGVQQEAPTAAAQTSREARSTKWAVVSVSEAIGLLKPFFEQRAASNELIDVSNERALDFVADDDNENKPKVTRTKSLVKTALVGRKKPNPAEAAKLARQSDLQRTKEAAKRKREAEKLEKAKLKEEKKALKKKKEGNTA